ncbi:MAG TPA: SWIM zinc finger family protein, partial [Salinimicrobium sp.]|nr:SWIM zinc finger family protein [Salinimicrobium sp.]
MKLSYKPFQTFVQKNTTAKTRNRYNDSLISKLEINPDKIKAEVLGSQYYNVAIEFDNEKVSAASCTCPYDQGGYCKHIVHVLVEADGLIQKKGLSNLPLSAETSQISIKKQGKILLLENQHILQLNARDIKKISNQRNFYWRHSLEIVEAEMPPNNFIAKITESYNRDFNVKITQTDKNLQLECTCGKVSTKICQHLHLALMEILESEMLQLPFNKKLRLQLFNEHSESQGLGEIENLDDFYSVSLSYGRIFIEPKHSFLSLS